MEKVTPLTPADTPLIRRAAAEDYELIVQMIKRGQVDFFSINQVALVTRLECDQVVIMCAEGRNVVPVIKQLAIMSRQRGYKSMRFHTKHRGLPRLLADLKPLEVERVYRIEV